MGPTRVQSTEMLGERPQGWRCPGWEQAQNQHLQCPQLSDYQLSTPPFLPGHAVVSL